MCMENSNKKYESGSRSKEYEMLNDPTFAGEEFFFPPFEDSEDEECDDEFSEEEFKNAAREILSDNSALIGRNIASSRPKVWRRAKIK